MPTVPLAIRPGINTEASQLLNESGWSSSCLVRFFQGYLQKYGGWLHLLATPLIGTCRAMLAWEDASANQYIACGTNAAFQVYTNSAFYNVTPIAQTDTVSVNFSTVSTTNVITIIDSDAPTATVGAAGNYVNILNPVSVGGLVLQGTYLIQSISSSTTYTIDAASPATGTVNNGGAAAKFTTTITSTSVKVTLNNHGLSAGGVYTVFVSTIVGGVTLFGAYNVATFIDANNFTIIASSAASGSTSGFENGGNVSLQYLLGAGNASSVGQTGLYGEGTYGGGAYGIGNSNTFVAARLWSFGYWGTDINASYTNGGFYTWISEDGLVSNPAMPIATAPLNINAGIFTAMPQQQAIALGASDGGGNSTDQMLVRFSDVADNTDWTASATNQAGSFRIPRGARIQGGLQGPQSAMIWTDVGLWLMQYIGFPLVYGFTEIGQGCGLIWQNAKAVLAGRVYWMSYNGFFVYDGNSVQPLPCPVWDIVFQNLNTTQNAKIIACPNSFFNEISWCFPSATGNGENDTRVTYNANDGTWTYDPPTAIVRTAWLDQSALLNPLGVDGNGLIQIHEAGNDADGSPMVCFAQTGFAKIAEGHEYTFIERIIPDAILESASLQITLYFQDYPDQNPIFTVGPLTYSGAQNYLIVRGRGRLCSIKVGSSDLGSFWRLGEILTFGSSAGRR